MVLEKKIVEQIKLFRKKKKITLKELTVKFNLASPTLSNYLRGAYNIPEKHYKVLSEVFPINKTLLKKGIVEFKKWK